MTRKYLNKIECYDITSELKKEILLFQSKIFFLINILFILLNVFSYFYKGYTNLNIIFVFTMSGFLFSIAIMLLLHNIKHKNRFNNSWIKKQETIENIDYVILTKHTEQRFFENDLLSHHQHKAVMQYPSDPWVLIPYHYNGEIIKAKNDEEFSKIVKTLSNLKDFK
jgi:hypothetical protein